jgi:hypothetical protein
MNELTRHVGILIDEASPLVMMPLLFVCFLLWALVLERASFYGETPWGFLIDGHRRKVQGRLRIWRSFHSWTRHPAPESREAFIHELDAHPSPLSLFLRRFTRDDAPLSPRLRELRLAEAAAEGTREIRRGLGLLRSLSRAALLLAVLGAVEGASRTFRDWTLSGSDPAAWSSGAITAILAPQAAAVVAALGMFSTSWLGRRAKELEDEILLARAHLGSPDGRPSWRTDR